MPRFMPFPDRPEAVMAYYQVPADIIEDADALVSWARKSVAVALSSLAAKHARKARPKAKAATTPSRKKTAKTKKTVKKKRAAPRAKRPQRR
jgi:TfoX/Sxy family transcriptional regulator of competence genes